MRTIVICPPLNYTETNIGVVYRGRMFPGESAYRVLARLAHGGFGPKIVE